MSLQSIVLLLMNDNTASITLCNSVTKAVTVTMAELWCNWTQLKDVFNYNPAYSYVLI